MTNFKLKLVECNFKITYNFIREVRKMNIGEKLYELRKEKHLSQEEVAESRVDEVARGH